jgi:hypothetical protein
MMSRYFSCVVLSNGSSAMLHLYAVSFSKVSVGAVTI